MSQSTLSRWFHGCAGLACLVALLGACSPARSRPPPGAAHERVAAPRMHNTGADRTAAAFEHSDRVMAGADSERGARFDAFGRGSGAQPELSDTVAAADPALLDRIRDALVADRGLSRPLLITVRSAGGAIVLGGTARGQGEQQLAVAIARRLAGTQTVTNLITLQK